MGRTKENNKGITMVSLVVTIVLLLILSVVTITTIRKQDIMSKTRNAEDDYNAMVANKYNEMDGDRVLNILDLDE